MTGHLVNDILIKSNFFFYSNQAWALITFSYSCIFKQISFFNHLIVVSRKEVICTLPFFLNLAISYTVISHTLAIFQNWSKKFHLLLWIRITLLSLMSYSFTNLEILEILELSYQFIMFFAEMFGKMLKTVLYALMPT